MEKRLSTFFFGVMAVTILDKQSVGHLVLVRFAICMTKCFHLKTFLLKSFFKQWNESSQSLKIIRSKKFLNCERKKSRFFINTYALQYQIFVLGRHRIIIICPHIHSSVRNHYFKVVHHITALIQNNNN